MTSGLLLILTLFSIVVMSASATAAQVLQEFMRHELEEYCLRRGRLSWFAHIIERRRELTLGAQTLQMISIATSIIFGLLYFFADRALSEVSPFGLLGLIGLWSLILLAANCWIPWGVLKIAAPQFLFATWRLWWLVSLALAPLIAGVEVVSSLFQRLSGQPEDEENEEENFEDEILSMVSEGEQEGLLEADARDMIEGVFELDDSVVGKVMTPRSKVDVIDVNANWQEMTHRVADTGRTRLPVVEGQFSKVEDVIGILFAKDLLAQFNQPAESRLGLRELVRHPMIVPLSKTLDEMLQQFLSERSHMAIVVDEYQSVAGVITIEDILEEIVGEIVDEMDEEEPGEILRISDRVVEVDGTVRIDLLNNELGLGLPENEDYDTLSGWIMSTLKSIPKRGQQLQANGLHVDIQQASRRTIERVRLTLLDTDRGNGTLDE